MLILQIRTQLQAQTLIHIQLHTQIPKQIHQYV